MPKKKPVLKKRSKNLKIPNKKFYIPLSAIIVIIGIILLQIDWMPFLGWIYVLMAFTSGLASLVKIKEKKLGKIGTATLTLGLSIVALLLVTLSLPILNNAFFKTYLDVKILMYFLF